APLSEVLQHWSGLGYYRRAHMLHRAAQCVVAEHGGEFPADAQALATLPGIGRSTAAAIAVFAYEERGAILDGNVKRVLARHEGVEGFPGAAPVERMLWQHAEALLPSRDVAAYTQALMDLGATICLRGSPRCEACPVATDCVARRDDRTAQLPAPRPKKILPRRALGVLLLERQGEVLLERRPATGIWAGLWSLPEIDSGDDAVQLCRARFGAEVTLRVALPAIEHQFTHFDLTLTPQPCLVQRWPKRAEEPGLLWLPLADVAGAALPAPIKTLLRTRARYLLPPP